MTKLRVAYFVRIFKLFNLDQTGVTLVPSVHDRTYSFKG